MRVAQARFEVRHEQFGRTWRRVAAVEQAVDDDVARTVLPGQARDGHRMAIDRVDATRSEQADEVQSVAAGGAPDRIEQRRVIEKRFIGDGGIDARQVLDDRLTGAQVQVADFAVTHLAPRQPNCLARRVEPRVRPLLEQAAPHRHARGSDGVGIGTRADAEAIEHHDHQRSWALVRPRWPAHAARRPPSGRPGRRCRPSRRP